MRGLRDMREFWAVLNLTLYQNTYIRKIALAKAIRDFKSILPFKLFKKGYGASQRTQPGGRLLQFSTKNTTRSEAKTSLEDLSLPIKTCKQKKVHTKNGQPNEDKSGVFSSCYKLTL